MAQLSTHPMDLVGLSGLQALTRGDARVRIGLVDGQVASQALTSMGANVQLLVRDDPQGSAASQTSAAAPDGHGTRIATLLIGGRYGLAPDCTLLVRPIFDERSGAADPPATAAQLAAGIRDCVGAGAQIINLSLEILGIQHGAGARLLLDALDHALASDVLVVAAAGNQRTIGGTALTRHPAVLGVAACGLDGRASDTTNLCRSIGERGLLAPGDIQIIDDDGSERCMTGTSIAAPFVTAAAALLCTLFPAMPMSKIRAALLGEVRPRRLVPPLLDAMLAYEILSRRTTNTMDENETSKRSSNGDGRIVAAGSTCGCQTCSTSAAGTTPTSPVYALGRVEVRFPTVALQKEYAQAVARGSLDGATDSRALNDTLARPENRYLVRQLCWVLNIEGLPTYILRPRESSDLDLLIAALRPTPRPNDIDVVIGIRGPLATPDLCNGLQVPIVLVDQIYSFDVDSLLSAIPKPADVPAEQFGPAAEELFHRIQQLADNAGALDEHRALNYLAVRYPAVYDQAAASFGRNQSLTAVETRASRLSGTRRILDVIFSFTGRVSDITEKFFVRVDVSEQFPFLVSKLAPYYDR
ncbi:MAG: S8 family serine peptidase [Deltaproteobacteria bacterium]|nr:S8 family serine peptidase [Nannocystaceae bacterium]